MKVLKLIYAATGLLLMSCVQAQTTDADITKSQIIAASADEVWERLRQLDGLEEIIPDFLGDSWLVASAEPGVGAKRSCAAPGTPKGQASYTEQILEYDDEKRYYVYAVVEGVPAKGMVNSFKVVDLGYQKCMVVWTSSMEAFIENPQMTEEQFLGFINSAGDAMLAGLDRLHSK
mgnify:CR=1 FL=1